MYGITGKLYVVLETAITIFGLDVPMSPGRNKKKWAETYRNRNKQTETDRNGQKRTEMDRNCQNRPETD